MPVLFALVICSHLIFMLMALPWGESKTNSYFVIYSAPVALCTMDFFIIFFLKLDKMTQCGVSLVKLCILIFVMGATLGMPLFVVFVNVTLSAYLDHWLVPLL